MARGQLKYKIGRGKLSRGPYLPDQTAIRRVINSPLDRYILRAFGRPLRRALKRREHAGMDDHNKITISRVNAVVEFR